MASAPHLVIVPASPISAPGSSRPSPTSTSATASISAPATPELLPADVEGERKSSETVFRIYSMYGRPGSWSADAQDEANPIDVSLSVHGDPHPALRAQPPGPHTGRGVARAGAKFVPDAGFQSPTPNGAPHMSFAESTRSSGPIYTLHDFRDAHHQYPHGSPLAAHPPASPPRSPPQSRPSSNYRKSSPYTEDAVTALSHEASPSSRPNSLLGTPSAPPRARTPSSRSRPGSRHHSPLPNGHDPSLVALPPSGPPSRTTTPRSPTPPPKDHRLSPVVSPNLRTPASRTAGSSKHSLVHSLVPSEGEDTDSFFVRSTYAQLEMSGVKGDGYEEGVERTRARLNPSRASELRAAESLGDGSEKTRELSAEEVALLQNLDRYGFFTTTSHDRLVLLPGAPLAKPLSRVASAGSAGPAQAQAVPRMPTIAPNPKEAARIEKWGRMLQPGGRDPGGNVEAWTVRAAKEGKLRERTYKGIPDRWRNAAWELFMARFAGTDRRRMEQLKVDYREALEKPSEYDIQIDLDVPRTISGHYMFRTRYGMGQRSLFHVLHCFSLRCTECGYVQGMGPIAATLLCYFEPERVYASLVRLHDAYAMHNIFAPGFPGLLESIYVQERLTEELMPQVYAAFKKHMVGTTSYATKWYITLFSNSVPFQTQLRLWDAFLLDGQDAFVVIALAIVWVYRDHITSTSASFETVLSLLSSFFIPEDEDALLTWIGKVLGDQKLRARMTGWREEWRGLVASGKSGDALL